MQLIDTSSQTGFFDVVGDTERSQAATMTLQPDQETGGPTNAHAKSDQWLFVISGHGRATVNSETHELHPGMLILIEPGETHKIANTSTEPLVTVNVYAPPEY